MNDFILSWFSSASYTHTHTQAYSERKRALSFVHITSRMGHVTVYAPLGDSLSSLVWHLLQIFEPVFVFVYRMCLTKLDNQLIE